MTEQQAAPDETSGRLPVGLRAGDLSNDHLGQQLKVVNGNSSISGVLCQVTHGASIINDGSFAEPDREVLGRHWTQVAFLGRSGARVDPWSHVELGA